MWAQHVATRCVLGQAGDSAVTISGLFAVLSSSAQMAGAERLTYADVAIYNVGTQQETRGQLETAWNLLLRDRVNPALAMWRAHEAAALQAQWTEGGQSHSSKVKGGQTGAPDGQPGSVRRLWRHWAALMQRLAVAEAVGVEWFHHLFDAGVGDGVEQQRAEASGVDHSKAERALTALVELRRCVQGRHSLSKSFRPHPLAWHNGVSECTLELLV